MRRTWWRSGTYNALCDVCGFKFKATELRQRWDGLMVCEKDWEVRHPQELIRPIQDQNKLPWTRPEPTEEFIVLGVRINDHFLPSCTLAGSTAVPGQSVPGCMIPGYYSASLL